MVDSQQKCKPVWDFRPVPNSELHACFLYEYARESATILKLAHSFVGFGFSALTDKYYPPYWKMSRINQDLANLLANLSNVTPSMDLKKKSWLDYSPKVRASENLQITRTAALFPSGFEVIHVNGSRSGGENWEYDPGFPDQETIRTMQGQIQWTGFQINWYMGLDKVLEDAKKWLTENRPKEAPLGETKKGRHAKPETFYRDALRQLGALRLLSTYPLKVAIEISRDYQLSGDSIYAGFIDSDGRPQGQTAWTNAINGCKAIFRGTFRLEHREEMLSHLAMERRKSHVRAAQK